MSAKQMGAVLKFKHINSHQKLVLMCLANRLNKDQVVTWIKQATMQKECAMSRSTVARSLYDLEERGYIGREKQVRASDGRKTSDMITLLFALEGFKEPSHASERDMEPCVTQNPIHASV